MFVEGIVKKAYLAFCFFVFLISFQFDGFNVVSDTFFDTHQVDSESLVMGRLVKTHHEGYLADGGFLGRYDAPEGTNFLLYQFDLHTAGLDPQTPFDTYRSSAGLQGGFYATTDQIFRLIGVSDGSNRHFLNRLLNSALLALLLTIFVGIIATNFGLTAAFTVMVLTASSIWIIVFADNLYWVLFLPFAPFLFVLWTLSANSHADKDIRGIRWLCFGVFSLMVVKSLAGYEYTSTILIAMVTPLIWFAIQDSWSPRKFLTRFVCLGISGVLGFATALGAHIWMLTNFNGSIQAALADLNARIAVRTYGNAEDYSAHIRDSHEADAITVLLKYWNGVAFNVSDLIGPIIVVTFGMIIIALAVLSVLGVVLTFSFKGLTGYRRPNLALTAAMWFSFSGPISWHILATAHSYLHGHISQIIWYLPFLLLGFAYIGFIIKLLITLALDFFGVEKMTIGWRLTILFAALFTLISYGDNQKQRNFINTFEALKDVNKDGLELYTNGPELAYKANNCRGFRGDTITLLLKPRDPAMLADTAKQAGVETIYFQWNDNQIINPSVSPLGSITAQSCVATIPLKSYPLDTITMGQTGTDGLLWENSVNLSNETYQEQFTIFDLTDNNWTRGLHKHAAGFFISNTFKARQSLRIGDKLAFSGGDVRVIETLHYSNDHINVFVSGAVLGVENAGIVNLVE